MNGIYDMGGMTCFGVIEREENEPVFHSDWERRVFAMNIASLAFLGPVDRARHARIFEGGSIGEVHHPDYLTVAGSWSVYGGEYWGDKNRNGARQVLTLVRSKFRDPSYPG